VPVLEAVDVSVRFGGVTALDGASLTVESGRITGLIGPNGAGKTTMFDVLSGLTPLDSGRVRLAGRNVTRMSPHRRARLGMARTFQRLELFAALTVQENIECAVGMSKGFRGSTAASARRVAEQLVRRVGLGSVAHVRAGVLPTGQARLVEVARALATSPRVLLLDEPASGQSDAEADRFAVLLGELAADGLGILLVEHDMDLVMSVSHDVVVLNFGRVIANAAPEVVRHDPAVIAAYLGTATAHD
jgi:branched-chain amino acid transport system ATP-binding protein